MSEPIIITVDDEPQVLNAIYRDLSSRYREQGYRIMKAGSGEEALGALEQLRSRNATVALLLADQRMPNQTGTEFLSAASGLYPDAKTALLTAYADTEAAISAINEIGLDFYLQKPWDPPVEKLYPVIDDLLADWSAKVEPLWDGIRVAGNMWSPGSHDAKDFLARNQVPYLWVDIEQDQEVREACEKACDGKLELPVIFFPDGTSLVAPDKQLLAEKVGMKTTAEKPFYQLVIIGGGPAGLGSAVYGATEGLTTALIERQAAGGQAGTSSRIENYLGFPNGVSGEDLARRATTQAKRFGAEILIPQTAAKIEVDQPYKHITLGDGSVMSCYAIMLCPGMKVRKLEVDGVQELTGAGVYYGATLTEAANYRGQPMFVVGGANSAGQAAMHFSRFASQVTMLVRSEHLEKRMSTYLVEQIDGTPNIEVATTTEVTRVGGDGKLQWIEVQNTTTGESARHEAGAMFIFIGSMPGTQFVEDLVVLDEKGFILTGTDLTDAGFTRPGDAPGYLETSVPGIFAAGDARFGSLKRVAAAIGDGAVGQAMVNAFLKKIGGRYL